MPLNDIQLSPHLVAELYKNSLIEEGDRNKAIISEEPKSSNKIAGDEELQLKYLGEFRKNILLVVNYPNAVYLPDEQLNFLTTILDACKLSLADIAIMNHTLASGYKEVFDQLKCGIVILFGITPAEFSLPIHFPEFQVQPFNHCTFLYAPELEKLETDKLLKSKFWVCLRKIFGV